MGRAGGRRAAAKSGAPVARGSVNALPFADASFDAAIAADVLCHRAVEPAPALAELRRVLRPGGRLVVNMPAYAWLLSAHDRQVHNARRCTARQLAAMLREAGFVPRARRATGTACCCRSWWCSASCWRATRPPPTSPRFRHGSMPCYMP